MTNAIPVIDISDLYEASAFRSSLPEAHPALRIGAACKNNGFFYIKGHGVSEALQERLEMVSRQFFALTEKEKMQIAMAKGGRAWRGYFPVGGELTSGMPDLKEGLYFGAELPASDRRVAAQLPLHGGNLFPDYPPELKEVVLEYLHAMTKTAHAVMRGIALSLDLDENYFFDRYTRDPLILFRIFHYPAQESTGRQWGVGEHTDYGLLTILKQDDTDGLQVKSRGAWIDAPPIANTFVCNIGDMLDRMTGGLYRSTPHRVLNTSGKSRYAYPFFFDPNFEAPVHRIENLPQITEDRHQRWDKESVHDFNGTYGNYLLRKVGKVFPGLQKDVL